MASIFLCTSIPAIRYGMGLSCGGAESVPCLITQGRGLSGGSLTQGLNDAQLFVQSRTLRIKQLLGLDGSMANRDLAAPTRLFCPIQDFHSLSRASGPAATSCGKLRPELGDNRVVGKIALDLGRERKRAGVVVLGDKLRNLRDSFSARPARA